MYSWHTVYVVWPNIETRKEFLMYVESRRHLFCICNITVCQLCKKSNKLLSLIYCGFTFFGCLSIQLYVISHLL